MNDTEITRWLGEKVMGREIHETRFTRSWTKEGKRICFEIDWKPLTDPRACAEVMEALRANGYRWEIGCSRQCLYAEVYRGEDTVKRTERFDDDAPWTRLFCLATVRATGGEV